MGIFDDLFAARSRNEKLIAEAEAVGNFEDVVRMGILCAQLGLVPNDIEKMARVYMLLQASPPESDIWVERTMRAIRTTRDGD